MYKRFGNESDSQAFTKIMINSCSLETAILVWKLNCFSKIYEGNFWKHVCFIIIISFLLYYIIIIKDTELVTTVVPNLILLHVPLAFYTTDFICARLWKALKSTCWKLHCVSYPEMQKPIERRQFTFCHNYEETRAYIEIFWLNVHSLPLSTMLLTV